MAHKRSSSSLETSESKMQTFDYAAAISACVAESLYSEHQPKLDLLKQDSHTYVHYIPRDIVNHCILPYLRKHTRNEQQHLDESLFSFRKFVNDLTSVSPSTALEQLKTDTNITLDREKVRAKYPMHADSTSIAVKSFVKNGNTYVLVCGDTHITLHSCPQENTCIYTQEYENTAVSYVGNGLFITLGYAGFVPLNLPTGQPIVPDLNIFAYDDYEYTWLLPCGLVVTLCVTGYSQTYMVVDFTTGKFTPLGQPDDRDKIEEFLLQNWQEDTEPGQHIATDMRICDSGLPHTKHNTQHWSELYNALTVFDLA